MPINIKSTQLTLTDSMEAYALKRLSAVEKFTKGSKDVVFDLELARLTKHHRKGDIYYAEVNLEVDGTLYRASAEGESLEAAVDEVKDEILRELRKAKTRKTSKARREEGKVKRALRGE